jgi:hypothetical protein
MASTTLKNTKYYVEHTVTPGDVARVRNSFYLAEEMMGRFMMVKKSAKAASATAAAKKTSSSVKRVK